MRPEDLKIVSARPVDWQHVLDVIPAFTDATPVYPDSTLDVCEVCEDDIYIGPRQQDSIQVLGRREVILLCFVCTAEHVACNQFIRHNIVDLGNPYKEPPRD